MFHWGGNRLSFTAGRNRRLQGGDQLRQGQGGAIGARRLLRDAGHMDEPRPDAGGGVVEHLIQQVVAHT